MDTMSSNTQTFLESVKSCSPEETVPCPTDWTKCVICQEDNPSDTLQCSAMKGDGTGYTTLADNLISFSELGSLPFNISRLDEGTGVEATLKTRSASVHKLCRLNYSKSRLDRERKRKSAPQENETKAKKTRFTRLSHPPGVKFKEEKCFFCEEKGKPNSLHKVSTFPLDKRVRKCALQLQDSALLAKLSGGDLVAQEAQYHAPCLVSLYKKAAQSRLENDDWTDTDKTSHGIALAELVMYIEEVHFGDNAKPIFLLSDLAKMYQERISQLGVNTDTRIHTTRLKERILSNFPDMQAYKQGKKVFLMVEDDVGRAISRAFEEDGDDEGFYLVKAARILRNEMLNMKSKFIGTFTNDCQESSVPQSLLVFTNMILEGPNIKPNATTQAAKTLSQLIQFNCHVRRRKKSVGIHHNSEREPPLPVYIGLDLHAQTRKRTLVDKMFELGLSISYDRVLAISTQLANSVCNQYNVDNVVCPQKLHGDLFTTAAVDNIDHNPSSTTAKDSFHGTGISLFQPTI